MVGHGNSQSEYVYITPTNTSKTNNAITYSHNTGNYTADGNYYNYINIRDVKVITEYETKINDSDDGIRSLEVYFYKIY